MKKVFADTYYYLAWINPKDSGHAQAVHFSQTCTDPIVTSEWVLLELGDALCTAANKPKFMTLLKTVQSDADTTIIPLSHDLLRRAIDLFHRRQDKDWSLTDCTSFLIMDDLALTDAATGDPHFKQAGFQALLLPRSP
jgi:uncharacterized protein